MSAPETDDRFAAARRAMVADQLRARGIADERVLAAMETVPRELFVDKALAGEAYADGALPIGHGQTISQPWVVAAICEALELSPDDVVLDAGAGSGYSTAVLAQIARRVIGVELVPELARRARRALAAAGVKNAEIRAGDAARPQPEAPFDAIAVHAAAPAVPSALAAQLRPGGRLVAPVAEDGADMLTAFRRIDDGSGPPELEARAIAPCRFVPLLGRDGYSG